MREGLVQATKLGLGVVDPDGRREVESGVVGLEDSPCCLPVRVEWGCQSEGGEKGGAKDQLAQDGHCV